MKPRYGTKIWSVTHHKNGGATVRYLGVAAGKTEQLKCGPSVLAIKEKGGGIVRARNWYTTDQLSDAVRSGMK